MGECTGSQALTSFTGVETELLVWQVRTFEGGASAVASLEELCDGIILNDILAQM